MKPVRKLLFASFFVAGLAGAACSGGNDDNNNRDGTPTPGDDDDDDDGGTPGPTPIPGTTFAAFVIDLIENQTADGTEPVAVDFDTTDDEAPGAFDSLF